MNEEIIIDIRLEKGDNEKRLKEVTDQIIYQRSEIDMLQKAIKNMNNSEKDNTELLKATTKNLELKKQKLSENTAEQKALTNAINAEAGSINALNAQNKLLIQQRNKLSSETEHGRAAIDKINKQIDANTEKIRSNSSAQEKQRMNIGNYASALDKVIPGLSGATQGIQSMTAAAWKFVANPIGAILAAIALAVAGTIAYFKQFAYVVDFVDDVVAGVSAAISSLIRNLNMVASILGSVVTGNFSQAADTAGQLADKMKEAADRAVELERSIRDLEDAEIDFKIASAATENQINRLILQSRNRSLSEQERIDKLNEALKLEEEQNKVLIKNSDEALRQANEAAAIKLEIKKDEYETEIEFGKRILNKLREDNALKLDEERDLIVERIIARENAEGKSLALQAKIQNQTDALLDKAAAEEEKRAAAREKQREKRKADEEKALAERQKRDEQQRKWDEEEFKFQVEQAKLGREKALKDIQDDAAKRRVIAAENYEKELELAGENDLLRLEAKQAYEDEVSRIEYEALEQRKAELIIQGQSTIEVEQQMVDARIKMREREVAGKKRLADLELSNKIKQEAAIRQLENSALALFKKNTLAYKIIATKQVIVDTVKAASSANQGMVGAFPGPLGIALGKVAAIAQIALGAVKVAEINGVQFAKGGIAQGPSHAQGGIPFTVAGRGGYEMEGGEAIINKKSTKMFRAELSAINEAGGGVKFAGGGITGLNETRVAARSAESTFQLNRSLQAAAQTRTVLVLQDFEYAQEAMYSPINRAQVI